MADTTACGCGFDHKVDVHAHFLPPCYAEALSRAGMTTLDGGFPVPQWSVGAALEMMDRNGIASAMISLSSPATHFLEPSKRKGLVREINEAGADLMRAHPARFGYFATLPMPDVPAALDEIAFAFDRLGADGVVLETNIDGLYLGNPAFAPVFDELDRREAVVFLHPTNPACFEQVGLGRPAPMIEFPIDTTRTIVDLLYSRTLQRCARMKVIVPHGGAALPALVARIAAFANLPFLNPRPASEAEVFETLERLFYDVALSAHPVVFSGLRRIAPISQILFGSDWPFSPEFAVARNVETLKANGELTEEDRRVIARENALRLFPRIAALAARNA
ncbi:amidohydrolase family protein [Parvibaculum sp.]|uniref:amidohydrolase family protein n=1 Tax=Parvibaculum sp. TaxID=2024848 RepID=UPI002C923059|nr:amidohydrolase family protein [Parvibaculum sp.]HUD50222.1 amidohydrolase family protein [Parvibaculum sp.]